MVLLSDTKERRGFVHPSPGLKRTRIRSGGFLLIAALRSITYRQPPMKMHLQLLCEPGTRVGVAETSPHRRGPFDFIFEPKPRAGISSIMVVKMSLASCIAATEHEQAFQLTPYLSTQPFT
jgi:hypothetical protein